MRVAKYISAFVVLLLAAGCTMIDLGGLSGGDEITSSSGAVTVLGRVTRYDRCDVVTRVDYAKDPNVGESKTDNMAFAVFKMEGSEGNYRVGNLIYYDYQTGSNITFILERGNDAVQNDGTTPVEYENKALYAMYVFANMPEMPIVWADAKIMTLDDFKAKAYKPKSTDYNDVAQGIPEWGFPMIGSIGDCSAGGDGKKLVLLPNAANAPMTVPTVDGVASDLLEVPMDAMYAKMHFSIELKPDQTIDGIAPPTFEMSGYTIHNIPGAVTFDKSSNTTAQGGSMAVADFEPWVEHYGSADDSQKSTIEFNFYIPEHYLTPNTPSSSYPYPFIGAGELTDANKSDIDSRIREEDEVLLQRFKPLLVEGQNAPYITIEGTYYDHQAHSWNVEYDIYLGGDNYGNFDIKRNTMYANTLTIRGIHNTLDASGVEGAISIDHRVNVTRTLPFIIGLRRESLLDAHFEVRPLRIRKNPQYKETISDTDALRISVEYLDDGRNPITLDQVAQKWIGLERSFGNGSTVSDTYINDGTSSTGKRKYFTTNLTYGTLSADSGNTSGGFSTSGGQSVVVPVPTRDDLSAEQCVWIYVDECAEASTDIEAKRYARIKVEYGSVASGSFVKDSSAPIIYTLSQHKLYAVTYNGQMYHIEHEEEYLYNFDSDDTYVGTPTFDDGMTWGLPNLQLSYDEKSLLFAQSSGSGFAGLISWIENYVKSLVSETLGLDGIFYDFYIPKHDTGVDDQATKRAYRGYVFNQEIINEANGLHGDTDTSNDVNVLALNETPKSAIEYCYNRNKRNANGQVITQSGNTADLSNYNWYLPAIDEIEDIMMSEFGAFDGVFQNNFYWSSQPAYEKNYCFKESGFLVVGASAEYYLDDVSRARATKVNRVLNEETGVYEYQNIPSGTIDYVKGMEITGWAGSYEGNWVNPGTTLGGKNIVGKVIPELGNLHRVNNKARVRCIRKHIGGTIGGVNYAGTNTSATE